MPPTLFGVIEKRDWAEHHLNLIEKSIGDFIDSDPCSIITDGHPERGVYDARLVYPKKLPFRSISLMIGDCVHNMRASLDYIAWELAGYDIKDATTMFPICGTADEFNKKGIKRIKRLPSDAQAAIERLQPYNTRYGGQLLALGPLNSLDIADKHKLLTVAVAVAEYVTAEPCTAGNLNASKYRFGMRVFPDARLEHNAVVATYSIFPPVPHMEVHFKVTPQVQFGKIPGFPKHAFVIPNLKLMLESVDTAIKRLRPFFK